MGTTGQRNYHCLEGNEMGKQMKRLKNEINVCIYVYMYVCMYVQHNELTVVMHACLYRYLYSYIFVCYCVFMYK